MYGVGAALVVEGAGDDRAEAGGACATDLVVVVVLTVSLAVCKFSKSRKLKYIFRCCRVRELEVYLLGRDEREAMNCMILALRALPVSSSS